MADKDFSVVDFDDVPRDKTHYVAGYENTMLTTLDNPFSPYETDDRWDLFDRLTLGYNTNQLLGRLLLSGTSDLLETEFGQEIQTRFYYSTLCDIVRNAVTIPYVLCTPDDFTEAGMYKHYAPKQKGKYADQPA